MAGYAQMASLTLRDFHLVLGVEQELERLGFCVRRETVKYNFVRLDLARSMGVLEGYREFKSQIFESGVRGWIKHYSYVGRIFGYPMSAIYGFIDLNMMGWWGGEDQTSWLNPPFIPSTYNWRKELIGYTEKVGNAIRMCPDLAEELRLL